jgi:hypothetical protein
MAEYYRQVSRFKLGWKVLVRLKILRAFLRVLSVTHYFMIV